MYLRLVAVADNVTDGSSKLLPGCVGRALTFAIFSVLLGEGRYEMGKLTCPPATSLTRSTRTGGSESPEGHLLFIRCDSDRDV